MVLKCEIHKKVFIYVYLQFKSELKENYLALTSLKIPLTSGMLVIWDVCTLMGVIWHADYGLTCHISIDMIKSC